MDKLIIAAEKFMTDESGATMVEYAMMAFFVAAICFSVVTILGTTLKSKLTIVTGSF